MYLTLEEFGTMTKLTFDKTSHRAYWNGIDMNLTAGEYRILLYLAETNGYASYRSIYDTLRGVPGFKAGQGEAGVNTNVRSAIKRIRRKFMNQCGVDPIDNYTAFGYGLKFGIMVPTHVCPTCNQLVRSVPETVVVTVATPLPAATPAQPVVELVALPK